MVVDKTRAERAVGDGRSRSGLRRRRRLVQGHGRRVVHGNGDPALADGSPGSGVDPASIPATADVRTDGSHTASGTARDNVGNEAAAGQPDGAGRRRRAPSLEVSCPATAQVGQSGVSATVSASDGQSGLASDPSGTVPINTAKPGPQTVERTASDNVGHSTSSSCTTQVGFTLVIGGNVKHKLVVKNGESVELTSTAKAKAREVEAGGSLDVEGALDRRSTRTVRPRFRICGATFEVREDHVSSSGPVTIGDGAGCAANTTSARSHASEQRGWRVDHRQHRSTAEGHRQAPAATTIVTGNTVGKSLTVTGNSGEVTDTPNTVGGKSKIQARRLGAK